MEGKSSDGDTTPEVATHQLPKLLVKNAGEPIKLTDVKLCGVSAEATHEPGLVKVWTRLALTSDDPVFHKAVEGLSREIARLTQVAGERTDLSKANKVLMVVRPDDTADLWVDNAAVAMKASVKRGVQAGTAIFDKDIVDIIELCFPCANIGSKDKVIYIFRHDWRFALYFDFNPDGDLALDIMSKTLGTLFRRLKYHNLYDLLANDVAFDHLIESGWFPFAEIMGIEFDALASACEANIPFSGAETRLLNGFDEERLERMFERWIARPHFKSKEPILRSAINAYNAHDWVSVLKIILTEIEGILTEAHKAATGKKSPKLEKLLDYAINAAEQKSGASDTLLLPSAFAKYLKRCTFANFNPYKEEIKASSRHAVSHGAAQADSYTQTRALQALLTLDQFAFYT